MLSIISFSILGSTCHEPVVAVQNSSLEMHILGCTMCLLQWTTSYLVTQHLVHKFKPLRTNSRENILKPYTLLHDSAWVSTSCPWINAKYGTHLWEMLWKKNSQKHRYDPQLSGVGNRLEDHYVLTIFLHFCVSLHFPVKVPNFQCPMNLSRCEEPKEIPQKEVLLI